MELADVLSIHLMVVLETALITSKRKTKKKKERKRKQEKWNWHVYLFYFTSWQYWRQPSKALFTAPHSICVTFILNVLFFGGQKTRGIAELLSKDIFTRQCTYTFFTRQCTLIFYAAVHLVKFTRQCTLIIFFTSYNNNKQCCS